MNRNQYSIVIHNETCNKALEYAKKICSGEAIPGTRLNQALNKRPLKNIGTAPFLELLVNTKLPQIFAESAVSGDGSDWNNTELNILGDIAIAVPVSVYDNGKHRMPDVYNQPLHATLLYIPGALLRNGRGCDPADLKQVTTAGQLETDKYFALYQRRLLPSFMLAGEMAQQQGKRAFITVPGLGCGCFAGMFRGTLGNMLKKTIQKILQTNSKKLKNVAAIYFDPYNECNNERHQIDHITFLVRPFTQGNADKPQLCPPEQYEEIPGEFSDCELFSVVAWDHVSWPGNDFYSGSRATDDGVKAAATSSMHLLTGITGKYNPMSTTYDPPSKFRNWGEVVSQNNLKISVADRLRIFPQAG